MTFFFDNNLSKKISDGLRAFGESAIHLQEHFPGDTPDVEWLKYVGENKYILVTRDERVRWNPAEKVALKQYGVGAFFLGGKNLSSWKIIEQVVRNWTRMKEISDKRSRPFAVRIPPSGTKFIDIPL